MKVFLDKIASCTRNVALHQRVVLSSDIPAKPGTILAVRVLDEKSQYNQIEDCHGRMMTYHAGDVVAGVLGERRALRGYSGVVPDTVRVGDILQLLNLGGVIGKCVSANPENGPPARVEVLGSILQFPERERRIGVAASIFPGPVALSEHLGKLPPAVFVAGTCMHSGKTRAACALIREATACGLKVGAAKITGVALRRDTLEMIDHGATVAFSFADAGLPSTCDGEVLSVAKGCLNRLAAEEVDLMVVELGDGLLGEYGVMDILADAEIKAAVGALILAAGDPVGAWGGQQLLRKMGLSATVVTGPATDNAVGSERIEAELEASVANAVSQPGLLGEIILKKLGLATNQPASKKLQALGQGRRA